MLETLRRKFTPILLFMITGAVALAMLFTDFAPSMSGGTVAAEVANVNGKVISYSEFNRAFQQRIEMFKGFTGKELTEKEIQQFGIKKNVINSLVQRELIIQGGEKLGIKVSPSELRDRIWSMLKESPYFKKNEKAQFDPLTYKQVISGTPYKSVGNFEKAVRSDILAQKTEEVIKSAALVSPEEVREAFLKSEDKVSLKFVEVETASIKKKMKISSSEIQKFLADQKNLDRSKNWFEANRDDYDQKEEVKASHILIRGKGKPGEAEKKAKDIHKQLNSSNFAKLADKHTEDPSGKGKGGSLGWFAKGAMVPEFEKTAFTLKPGEISKPLKTNFGWHIIHVIEKREEKKADFEKVKNDVAKAKVRDMAKEIAESFASSLNSGSGLKSLESKHSVKAKNADGLTSSQGLPGNLRSAAVLKEAFLEESELSKNAKVFEAAGGFIAVKLVKRMKPDEGLVKNLRNQKPEEWKKLSDQIQREKEQRLFEAWVETQRKKSKIVSNEEFLNS
jgi:peptidyl-prolyl cis-trans isomerase D